MKDLLEPAQRQRLEELERLAVSLNRRLNLYSEESCVHFWQRHVLHSLVLAQRPFPSGAEVVDWGTGGGMPGLPLAVVFPEVTFHLVDAVGKKVRAVETLARRIGLQNVTCYHTRAEEWKGTAHYSVSRATVSLTDLWAWHCRIATPCASTPNEWLPGLICLKGGNVEHEIAELAQRYPEVCLETYPASNVRSDPYFEHKFALAISQERPGHRDSDTVEIQTL